MKLHAPTDAIVCFRDEHFCLSNVFPCPLVVWGENVATYEHAYQCAKFTAGEFRDRVKSANTPKFSKWLARRLGGQHRLDGHAERRFEIMLEIFRAKLSSHEMAQRLLTTGGRLLIEGNDWSDRRWGCVQSEDGSWREKNWLSEILMQVRDELRSGTAH